jgi:nicotinamidase-related amidase
MRGSRHLGTAETALVVIDPQNDFLSPSGSSWSLVGRSVRQTGIIGNLHRLFRTAKLAGIPTIISPHYFFPTDHTWRINGPLEAFELKTRTFARSGPLELSGFRNSGADWFSPFKPYIEDGKTIVASPHKVFGPQTNDVVLQLRKRRINRIVLAGMLSNMCVESHLREFLEQGFEIAVVKDAIAGPIHPKWGDGYRSAMINYRFLAHAILSTDQAVALLQRASPGQTRRSSAAAHGTQKQKTASRAWRTSARRLL